MRILSLSSVYPNPGEPGLGLFVRSRLQQMAARAEIKVIAPIPLLDYSHPGGHLIRPDVFPRLRQDGAIEVFHPRWLFPPGGTPVNVGCLVLRLLPLVRRIRQTFPFDLIDAHFGYPEGVAAALLADAFRVPYTVTLRGSETVFAGYRHRRKVLRWAMRRARGIVTVSEDLRKFAIEQGVAPERTRTIPNGIDPALFFHRDRLAARFRQNLPSGRRLIVSAGELIEAKGHHLVIRAMRSLLARGVDAGLTIVGSTARGGRPYENELRRLVSELGLSDRVRFMGWVDRNGLAELLSAADLFCLASFTEGWPNVVHEALACGTPVVASAVGGIPSLVPSEQFGYTVPPRDLASLTDALGRGLATQWDAEAISGWGRSRTWADVARETIEFQQSLLEENTVEFSNRSYANVRN